jgi:mRNA interferase RelE/StbE
MQDGLSGDIKKLSQHAPGYRLRVGDYRVLFDLEGRRILIADVKHRREAYS